MLIDTIGSLIEHPHKLGATCHTCHHFRWLDLQALGERLGFEHSTMHDALAHKLVCEKCGGKDIALTLSAITHHRSPLER